MTGPAQVDREVLGELPLAPVAPYTQTVLASSTRPHPDCRAASRTRAVPSTFSRTAHTGSAATSLTLDAPARWNTAAQSATAAPSPATSNRSTSQYVAPGLRHRGRTSMTRTSWPPAVSWSTT